MSLQSLKDVWWKLGGMRDDMHPVSLLLAGICIQSLLALFLPGHIVILPAACWLAYRGTITALVTVGYVPNPYLKGAYLGPSQATIPNTDGSVPENTTSPESGSDKGLVCFLVRWSTNHPLGSLAPGATETLEAFSNNWVDAEANREELGFLGKTPPLVGRSNSGGTHLVTISYWKDLEHLAAFSRGSTHRAGMQFFYKIVKKHRHLGLMHETHVVPRGHWENIYNHRQTKHLVTSSTGESTYMSSIVKAKPGGIGFKRLQNLTLSSL